MSEIVRGTRNQLDAPVGTGKKVECRSEGKEELQAAPVN